MKNRKSFNSKKGQAMGDMIMVILIFAIGLIIAPLGYAVITKDEDLLGTSPVNAAQVIAPTTTTATQSVGTSQATPASDFVFNAVNGTLVAYVGTATDIVIPNQIDGVQVTTIGSKFAYQQNKLTSVTIPEGVNIIGDYAFAENPITTLRLPNSLQLIQASAFERTLLTDLVMPAAVKEIGDRAFAETPSLKYITFSEGLLRIGESSFSGSGLTSVTLPRSLSLIGSGAFSNSPIQTATVDKNTSVSAKTEVFSAGAIVKTYEGLDWTTLAH